MSASTQGPPPPPPVLVALTTATALASAPPVEVEDPLTPLDAPTPVVVLSVPAADEVVAPSLLSNPEPHAAATRMEPMAKPKPTDRRIQASFRGEARAS